MYRTWAPKRLHVAPFIRRRAVTPTHLSPFHWGAECFRLGESHPLCFMAFPFCSQQIWERPSDERSSTPLARRRCWMISRSLDLFTHLSSRGPFVPSAFLHRECEFFAFATRGAASRVPLEVSPKGSETWGDMQLSRTLHILRSAHVRLSLAERRSSGFVESARSTS